MNFQKIALSVFVFFGLISIAQTVGAQFDPLQEACVANPNAAICVESKEGQTTTSNPINTTIGKAANIIAVVSSVIAVIVIVIAGITTTLSNGDAGKVKSSRDAIVYAAVGLVVINLARIIVFFIANRL
jgi:hypothetical protein